jgi:hypothetical protein
MTHNDYALIAQVFADLNSDFNNGGSDEVSLSIVAQELARALENDNPRQFHESAFLKACGIEGGN